MMPLSEKMTTSKVEFRDAQVGFAPVDTTPAAYLKSSTSTVLKPG
jgi:hypothetical protein